jgi:uncharacterized protein YbaP (TraB family)
LWEVEGADNRIRLMGSVHFLRQTDYPLPAGLEVAYDEADALVMEIDMSSFGPQEAQAIVARLGTRRSLREVMGEDAYMEARERAADTGIDLAAMDPFEPWLAAITVTQIRMMQMGFDPNWGIESRLTARALSDGKPISGLETVEQQLGFMAGMDDATQTEFLLQSLDEASRLEAMVDSIVRSWRNGDTDDMVELMLVSFAEVPELEDALLIQRNRNWIAPIESLLDADEDYLVIVGAMHLVGDNSVVAMLRDKGIAVRQLTDDDFR